MPAGSPQFLNFNNLPVEGALLVPGRLEFRELATLAGQLGKRRITWLIEEDSFVEPATRDYLAREDVVAATFSKSDPSPEDIGQALASKIADGGFLVFIPTDVATHQGTGCRIPGDVLKFLCRLGLPTVPVAVHLPREASLSVDPPGKQPRSIMVLGEALPAGEATVAAFREKLMCANEAAFSSRSFLDGSLSEALIAGLKRWGSSTALIDGSDDSTLPYSKLMGASIALSKEIRKATRKKRVGIILPPGRAGMVANLAVLFAGKIPVNINFTASEAAVKSAIRQADLDKFITADPFVRKMASFAWPPNRDLFFIERVLPTIRKKIIRWVIAGKLLPAKTISRMLGLDRAGRGDDEAILLFTSGSSGEPKGVPLSHRNVLANVCQFGTRLSLSNDAKILGSLPLFHSFGCTVTLWYPIIEGLGLVTYPSPLETRRLAELVAQHKVHLLLSTPTFLRGFMRRVEPEMLASIEKVVTGAEKLPESLARAFEEKFGTLPLEGYGLTETSPATNVNLPDVEPDNPDKPVLPNSRFGSVGQLLPGIAVRMTDAATDNPIPIDKSGIIWLKGPNIFQGYLDRPDLTKEILKDGWFKTGDVGRMDDDGFLYIEGRISRFSKIAGEMVPHETVEAAITKALGLDGEAERKIAVVGIADVQKGEAIALLSCVAGELLEQEVVDIRYKLMDMGIPSLWCPKKIMPVEEIPVLASGKLDIKACQALADKS